MLGAGLDGDAVGVDDEVGLGASVALAVGAADGDSVGVDDGLGAALALGVGVGAGVVGGDEGGIADGLGAAVALAVGLTNGGGGDDEGGMSVCVGEGLGLISTLGAVGRISVSEAVLVASARCGASAPKTSKMTRQRLKARVTRVPFPKYARSRRRCEVVMKRRARESR